MVNREYGLKTSSEKVNDIGDTLDYVIFISQLILSSSAFWDPSGIIGLTVKQLTFTQFEKYGNNYSSRFATLAWEIIIFHIFQIVNVN